MSRESHSRAGATGKVTEAIELHRNPLDVINEMLAEKKRALWVVTTEIAALEDCRKLLTSGRRKP